MSSHPAAPVPDRLVDDEVGTAHVEVHDGDDAARVLVAARDLLATGHGLPHVTVRAEPCGSRTRCSDVGR